MHVGTASWPLYTSITTLHTRRLYQSALARRARRAVVARTSLYDLLSVEETASSAEIRAAYRRLAALYHPDVNSSRTAHETFQALKQAAEVLTSDLRQQYDAHGLAALSSADFKVLHGFLKRARAQGAAAVLGQLGDDISTVLGLEFNEAVTGTACTVTTGALGTCPDCKGTGFDPTQQVVECPVCGGSGEITVKKWHQAGQPRLTVLEVCPACRGNGRSEVQSCKRCSGEGRVQVRRHVRIRVPAGVADGQVLRVRGQGHMGRFGGLPGDLLVRLQVYDLADVTRRGDNLYSKLIVGLYEALLGTSVDVTTVRGQKSLIVPAGTQHGQVLCVKGAGVARPGVNGVVYGNHYFEVSVLIPSAEEASTVELKALQELGRLLGGSTSDHMRQQAHQ